MAAPEGLMTTTSEAEATAQAQSAAMPEMSDAMLQRAFQQREAREAAEREALLRERDRQGYKPAEATPLLKAVAQSEAQAQRALQAARTAVQSVGKGEPLVRVRITKLGDGKVSMGEHVPGVGEAYYLWKETPEFPRHVALALERRGLVEIEE